MQYITIIHLKDILKSFYIPSMKKKEKLEQEKWI